MQIRQIFMLVLYCLSCGQALSQRQYAANSVLQSGQWFKISVTKEGVYKVDVPFLASLGLNSANLPSSSIRLYGNGGAMLPETNAEPRKDDLYENAIEIVDGGDGLLNGQDYFLFYAAGPVVWTKDSANRRFNHALNIYSDKCFYFITIGGTGKRISLSSFNGTANVVASGFNERLYHEVDTINFLKSGKQWYGEEFSNTPGYSVSRSFTINLPGLQTATPVTLQTSVAARSVGAGSGFDIR